MPLIVITGIPASGKTTRANELKQFFEEKGKTVHVISENQEIVSAGFEKNAVYADANKEKHIRSLLKSNASRVLNSQNVVILDGLNYIKGYRYELFCTSKSIPVTQCTVHAEINREEAWKFNENRENEADKYDEATFKALVQRYEEPIERNRWDAPLFTIFPEQTLDKDAILACLFDRAPPPPNKSTQNPPLSQTNFLYDLDKVTSEITNGLVHNKNMGVMGFIKVEGYPDLKVDISNATTQQLISLRRQYLVYSRRYPPNPQQIPQLFVEYLNTNLNTR